MECSALRIKDVLEKKEYKNIISDDVLFTSLFCDVFNELDIGDDVFNISLNESNNFKYYGKNRVIDEIFIFIDKLRLLLLKNLFYLNETKFVSISFIEMAKTFYIKQSAEIINKYVLFVFVTCVLTAVSHSFILL